jgi:regulator of nucleoside diphosphate kinase
MIMAPLYMTQQDRQELHDLIEICRARPNGAANNVDALEREVSRSRVLDGSVIPPDVITMNSRVRLRDMDSDEVEIYTLVYPAKADPGKNRISVLAPVGTAILGCRKGDVIEWPVPAGVRRLLVEDVLYQPERATSAVESL